MQAQQQVLADRPATNNNLLTALLESVDDEPLVIEPLKRSLNEVFTRYRAMAIAIEHLAKKQQEFELEYLGRQITDTPSLQGIRRIADAALSALFGRAETQFAPAGTQLSINQTEALERNGQENWRMDYERQWDKFRSATRNSATGDEAPMILDLDRLWEDLEQTLGGDAGITAGYKQQAKKIVVFFNLERDNNVNKTKNYFVLTARIWSEKKDYGSNKGMFEPHHSCGQRVREIMQALGCFAKASELNNLAMSLEVRHEIAGYGFAFNPREKVVFPGMEIALFKDKWEFRFSHTIAEKLMMFLGEYASQ